MTDTPGLLYKFLPAEFALRALEEKRLKVARLMGLNDIFDCSPKVRLREKDGTHEDGDEYVSRIVQERLNDDYGLICFAQDFTSPLLWGHYAAGGTGLALAFSGLAGNENYTINYCEDRYPITISLMSKDLCSSIVSMFNTKAKAWQYEQERRLVVELKDCAVADGMYFYSFIPIHLRQVIIGSRSQIRRPYIQHLLSRYDYPDHVEVKVAGPHPDKYEIRLKD